MSRRSRQKDRGASAVEYGLMVAAIAAVIVGVVFGLGTMVRTAFSQTCQAIYDGTSAQAPGDPLAAPSCPGDLPIQRVNDITP